MIYGTITDKNGTPITANDYVICDKEKGVFQIFVIRSAEMIMVQSYPNKRVEGWTLASRLTKVNPGSELIIAMLQHG